MSALSTMAGHISRPIGRIMPAMIAISATAIVLVGWIERDEGHLTPEAGLGYWLGICGSAALLLMLVYSLRKRVRMPRWFGSVPLWFRIHMLMGVAAPVLILFHANFALGALNSNVALLTMLMVACSGVVGRYLYRKVHSDLSGHKARIKELLVEAEALKCQMGDEFPGASHVVDELAAFGRRFEERIPRRVLSSLLFGGYLAVSVRITRARLIAGARQFAKRQAAACGWSWRERRRHVARISDLTSLYFDTILKTAEYAFYERLFALWHFLHLPLFVLMVLSAAVHVWAVHKY